ncbi:hypothetical protein B0H15DRAFT_1019439 [Mycena belliarum]|uniref:Uncharacterized protein n=1 Tax=Mycena belliarum TaxID=1033014 RepID=A0AAD6XW32_9AGAR|nr:hypothetical protein B0H15DRAFT_1019439 [Mycena belliae]
MIFERLNLTCQKQWLTDLPVDSEARVEHPDTKPERQYTRSSPPLRKATHPSPRHRRAPHPRPAPRLPTPDRFRVPVDPKFEPAAAQLVLPLRFPRHPASPASPTTQLLFRLLACCAPLSASTSASNPRGARPSIATVTGTDRGAGVARPMT